ncbi:hypothetical protein FRC12_010539 [Ceratobasidium sp. 428]|nr:hypothetical protein FRC12_010539 [Ceratobasidium sp. 428]
MPQEIDVLHPGPATRVFEIPELVWLIGGFAHKSDSASLLRSSRRIFASIAPILWEDIDLRFLMLLIPGLGIRKTVPNQSYLSSTTPQFNFTFPEKVDTCRLKLYEPFVRIVRTMGSYVFKFDKKWPLLSVPLLPNLQRLVINAREPTTMAEVDWIPQLLTSNLQGFEMRPIEDDREYPSQHHSWLVAPGICLYLLNRVALTCLQINTLRVFLAAPETTNTTTGYRTFLDRIVTLKHLSVLALGTVILDQKLFEALGQLPRLKVLSLHSDESQFRPGRRSEVWILDDFFPSLRELELRGIKNSTIQRIHNFSSIFRRLERASIISCHDTEFSESSSLNDVRSGLAIQFFGANCLHMVELTLLMPQRAAGFSLSSPGALDALKQMPLRRLRLGRVLLRPWDTPENPSSDLEHLGGSNHLEIRWQDFLAAVPHLEELRLETQHLRSSRLPLLASMLSNLRIFTLLIIIFDQLGEQIDQPAMQPLSIQCEQYTAYDSDGGKELLDFSSAARYDSAGLQNNVIIHVLSAIYTTFGRMRRSKYRWES